MIKTTNLELSKELKANGFPQESTFWWNESDGVEDRLEYSPNFPLLELVAAPTAEEILDQMDSFYFYKGKDHKYYFEYTTEYPYIDYKDGGGNLADAAAQMYLFLKKEKLLS